MTHSLDIYSVTLFYKIPSEIDESQFSPSYLFEQVLYMDKEKSFKN